MAGWGKHTPHALHRVAASVVRPEHLTVHELICAGHQGYCAWHLSWLAATALLGTAARKQHTGVSSVRARVCVSCRSDPCNNSMRSTTGGTTEEMQASSVPVWTGGRKFLTQRIPRSSPKENYPKGDTTDGLVLRRLNTRNNNKNPLQPSSTYAELLNSRRNHAHQEGGRRKLRRGGGVSSLCSVELSNFVYHLLARYCTILVKQ